MQALLKSINQNQDTQVSFAIEFLDTKEEQGQSWQYYRLLLNNGKQELCFDSIQKTVSSAVGTLAEVGKFAFAIKPHNELDAFIASFDKFLSTENKSFRFEPSDPSFELIIEAIPVIRDEVNYKVYFWVDAGNTKALEYTWDSLGVRFISSKENLRAFAKELKAMLA